MYLYARPPSPEDCLLADAAPAPAAPHNTHDFFNDPHADLVLISNEGLRFLVSKHHVARASGLIRNHIEDSYFLHHFSELGKTIEIEIPSCQHALAVFLHSVYRIPHDLSTPSAEAITFDLAIDLFELTEHMQADDNVLAHALRAVIAASKTDRDSDPMRLLVLASDRDRDRDRDRRREGGGGGGSGNNGHRAGNSDLAHAALDALAAKKWTFPADPGKALEVLDRLSEGYQLELLRRSLSAATVIFGAASASASTGRSGSKTGTGSKAGIDHAHKTGQGKAVPGLALGCAWLKAKGASRKFEPSDVFRQPWQLPFPSPSQKRKRETSCAKHIPDPHKRQNGASSSSLSSRRRPPSIMNPLTSDMVADSSATRSGVTYRRLDADSHSDHSDRM